MEELTPENIVRQVSGLYGPLRSDSDFERIRTEYFSSGRINLNPGTLGAPHIVMRDFRKDWTEAGLDFYPLGAYSKGREFRLASERLLSRMVSRPKVKAYTCQGVTKFLLSSLTSIIASANLSSDEKFTILTSDHEHSGGIGVFEEHSDCQIVYLSKKQINDHKQFTEQLKKYQPHMLFLSHSFYDTGDLLDLEILGLSAKEVNPNILNVFDVAQTFGVLPLPQVGFDLMPASLHKWMGGPRGMGVCWITEDAHESLWPLGGGGFDNEGGDDFSAYGCLFASLSVVHQHLPKKLGERSNELVLELASMFEKMFPQYNEYFLIQKADHPGTLSLRFMGDCYPLYQFLNDNGVHVKCIKKTSKLGRKVNLLRIGIPYYESTSRLQSLPGLFMEFYRKRDLEK